MAKARATAKMKTYRVTASKKVRARSASQARSKARRGLGLRVKQVGR